MLHDKLIPAHERAVYATAYAELASLVEDVRRAHIYFHEAVDEKVGKEKKTYHSSMLFLDMEFIDMLDGISVLVKEGAAIACKPLLRTALELYLNMDYLTADDKERRGTSYEYWHFWKKSEYINKADPSHHLGKQIRAELKNEELGSIWDEVAEKHDIPAERVKIEAILNNNKYKPYHDEKMASNAKHWYSMWGGPKSLDQLAKQSNHFGIYEFYYRHWSQTAHGVNAMSRFIDSDENVTNVRAIRAPDRLTEQVVNAFNLSMFLVNLLKERFVPEKAHVLAAEYVERLRPKLHLMIRKYKSFNDPS